MITVIKGCRVYSPDDEGIKDIVIAGEKIEGIYDSIDIKNELLEVEVIDGKNKILFPGFIDLHVHIMGAGGESGYNSRTLEIQISELTKAGITSVVGCIGTDGICRNIKSLIAKVKGLKEEGISAYAYTGSYEVPVVTLTDSIKEDIMLIDEIIGTGEIALSDHRSSQPSFHEFISAVAQSRVGGILSNKSGIVNIHVGDGERGIEYLFRLKDETEIPLTQVLPTHINRNSKLFNMGLKYVKSGGFIDLTTSSDLDHLENGELRAGDGLKAYLDEELSINHITFSSDGNGSMPRFDNGGKLEEMKVCSVNSLYREVKYAIQKNNVPIEKAIRVITANSADILKLKNKGYIKKGNDADLVMVDAKTLEIDTVFAKGKKMVENKKALIKGFFEID